MLFHFLDVLRTRTKFVRSQLPGSQEAPSQAEIKFSQTKLMNFTNNNRSIQNSLGLDLAKATWEQQAVPAHDTDLLSWRQDVALNPEGTHGCVTHCFPTHYIEICLEWTTWLTHRKTESFSLKGINMKLVTDSLVAHICHCINYLTISVVSSISHATTNDDGIYCLVRKHRLTISLWCIIGSIKCTICVALILTWHWYIPTNGDIEGTI